MRDANVASTLRIVQVCCSNVGFGAAVMVDAGDVVSHDAISRSGNNHPARQRRMYIQILYFRANRGSMTRLALPPQRWRQALCVLQRSRRKRGTLLIAQRCPRTTALSNATVCSESTAGLLLLSKAAIARTIRQMNDARAVIGRGLENVFRFGRTLSVRSGTEHDS